MPLSDPIIKPKSSIFVEYSVIKLNPRQELFFTFALLNFKHILTGVEISPREK